MVTMGQILVLKFSYFLIRWSEILCVYLSLSLSLSLSHTHTDTHTHTETMCSPLCGKLGLLSELGHLPSRSMWSTRGENILT